MKQYVERKTWTSSSVQQVCIKNDLFTAGDNDEYFALLNWIDTHNPDTRNIQKAAEYINDYSDNQDVANIMYMLANYAVTFTYEEVQAV